METSPTIQATSAEHALSDLEARDIIENRRISIGPDDTRTTVEIAAAVLAHERLRAMINVEPVLEDPAV